ncbi:MAG: D-alanyl-D-alanine carboxypeptidase/D-alanyl-D-alanine-endopeptidase [Planctomycetota bacterium]
MTYSTGHKAVIGPRSIALGVTILVVLALSALSGVPVAVWGERPAKSAAAPSSDQATASGADSTLPPEPVPAFFDQAAVDVLSQRIEASLGLAKSKTKISFFVADPATRQVLFARNETLALVPASNMKVITAAAAYDLMGPNWEFETEFSALDWEDGVARGGLVVKGSGDPSAGFRFSGQSFSKGLDGIADRLVAAGLREVKKGIFAAKNPFVGPQRGERWPRDSYVNYWMVELAPLIFNDNQIRIQVRPQGTKARISFLPAVGYGRAINKVSLVSNRSRQSLQYNRQDDKPVYTVKGKLYRKGRGHDHDVNVANGSLYYLSGLRAALKKRGVVVPKDLSESTKDWPKARLTSILIERSPLKKIVKPLLKRSQNLYAEIVFRQLGQTQGAEGSFAGGTRVIANWLKREEIFEEGTVIRDGSGLSRANALGARQLASVLTLMWQRRSIREVFRASLAEPGKTGTLRKRMTGLKGRVFAKTGTLTGMSTLSGYVRSRGGRWLVFAGIFNGGATSTSRRIQDRICDQLAAFGG